tara:strand:- start:235 stop:687 length:453 start_codon:yes stop_codon:yes gene_type:complete
MIKENAIDIELSEIVREFESMEFDKIGESFAIKTFKNGKIKFEQHKGTYFYARRVLNSYNNGYSLEIDFHYLEPFMTKKEKQSRNIDEVMKDIEDYKIYFEPFHKDKFKYFYHTNLYRFFDDIIDLNDYMDLDNVNASDAYKLEKSIISA